MRLFQVFVKNPFRDKPYIAFAENEEDAAEIIRDATHENVDYPIETLPWPKGQKHKYAYARIGPEGMTSTSWVRIARDEVER